MSSPPPEKGAAVAPGGQSSAEPESSAQGPDRRPSPQPAVPTTTAAAVEPKPKALDDSDRARLGVLERSAFADAESYEPPKEEKPASQPAAARGAALERARAVLADLPAKAKLDRGAAFEASVLDSLLVLRDAAPAEWQRLRAELKSAGVALGQLDRALRHHRRQGGRAVAERASRPRILVHPNVRALVDQAEELLAASEVGLYHRGGELVRVLTREGRPRILPLASASLLELLSDVATWLRPAGEDLEPVLPPREVVEALAHRGTWRLPELVAVVDAPTLRLDGTVLQEPGYDPSSRILYVPSADYPRVPERPTRAQARAALDTLCALFCDFPFLARSDRAALLAFLITLLARRAIDGPVPLFLIRATCPGSGKTLGVDVVSYVALGVPAARMAQGQGYSEEQEKRILALGREGVELALLDNVERALGSDVLAAALTARTWRGRVLGQSATVEVPLPVFAATGNNVVVAGDLGRRVVPIDLQVPVEHPEEREGFRQPDLLAYVRAHRPRLVAAGLTVLRWYVAEGRPAADLPPFGSFEAWSGLVRSALVWLGEDDPCAGRQRIREDGDPQREAWCRLLEVWQGVLGERTVGIQELIAAAERQSELRDALAAVDARLDPARLDGRRLGYALRRVAGRILNGRQLVRPAARTRAGAVWCVLPADRGTAAAA